MSLVHHLSFSFHTIPWPCSVDLAATAITINKCPTLAQAAQFLAAHARIICVVHSQIGTTHPVMVGFVKPTHYPSPANALVLFATSIPTYTTMAGGNIHNIVHNHMWGLLEEEVGMPLVKKAGQCVEDHGFLGCVIFWCWITNQMTHEKWFFVALRMQCEITHAWNRLLSALRVSLGDQKETLTEHLSMKLSWQRQVMRQFWMSYGAT